MKTVNELISDFLGSIDRADSTLAHYRKVLEIWRDQMNFLRRTVDDITPAEIITWIRKLQEKKRAAATIDNYVATLRAFYGYLEAEGIADNIMKNIGRQTGRHSNFTRQSLTAEQLFQLLTSLKAESLQDLRNAAAIKLMSLTGLRCIEVSRCDHGDLKNVSGKWYLQIQRKGEREKGSRILLPDEVNETLQRYLERKDNADDFDAPLFSNAGPNSPGKRLSPRFLSRTVKKHLRAIGLNNRAWSAHSLRHTAACLASTSGCEIEEISSMLGHSTISQTNTYLKSLGLRSGIEDRAINRVNDYWKNFKKNAHKDTNQQP